MHTNKRICWLILFCRLGFSKTVIISNLKNANRVSFSAIGDWGGMPIRPYQTPWGTSVAESMNNLAGSFKTDFVLLMRPFRSQMLILLYLLASN